jgi:hypothetical protein
MARVKQPQPGLTFTPGNHQYRLDGTYVPGVTTILKVLDKPALPKWAAGLVAEWVADNPNGVNGLRSMGRGPMIAALKEVPWEMSRAAGDKGTAFHKLAEDIIWAGAEVDVPETQVPLVENAIAFMEDWHIEPVLTEASVASRQHWFAGTLDLIAKYRRPDTGQTGIAILDWKSGKKIYPEAAFQLNAYAHAEFHGLTGNEQPLPACDAGFGVHIREDGYDVYPVAFGPDIFQEFLTIRQSYDIKKRADGDYKRPGSGYVGIAVSQSREETAA